MSHQRYPSLDPQKEPHSISLRVLRFDAPLLEAAAHPAAITYANIQADLFPPPRLSRPSLVVQYPVQPPTFTSSRAPPPTPGEQPTWPPPKPIPASLAYTSSADTNTDPFVLSPALNLPPSFGSAYVGETFSCTLCANHDAGVLAAAGPASEALPMPAVTLSAAQQQQQQQQQAAAPPKKKIIRDVRLEAEMKTPGSAAGAVQRLELTGAAVDGEVDAEGAASLGGGGRGTDLEPGQTLQRVVNFDLKEEGNHVLAVTVSYYEATETSGRTRTFRKLYQFVCKGSLIVRTKVGPLAPARVVAGEKGKLKAPAPGQDAAALTRRRWVLEAQLENCSEDTMQLERIALDLEPGLQYLDCNGWEGLAAAAAAAPAGGRPSNKPILQPSEVEQICFVVEEAPRSADGPAEGEDAAGARGAPEHQDGRVMFGVLGIGWRSEMGNKGFISTGRLGTRYTTK